MLFQKGGGFFCVQLKMILFGFKQSFFLHLAEFVRQGTAVYAEVIGELLAVEGNRKTPVSAGGGLVRQIRHEAAANRL